MKKQTLIPALIVAVTLLAYRQATSQQPSRTRSDSMERSAAATYEHLATAIIEIEATEDELVKSILLGYHAAAQDHLKAAAADEDGPAGPPGSGRGRDRQHRQRRRQAHPGDPPASGQGRTHA